MLHQVEALEGEFHAHGEATSSTSTQLQILMVEIENASKERNRLEQTIRDEQTRVIALEHERDIMKSNREAETENWDLRVRDLKAEIV